MHVYKLLYIFLLTSSILHIIFARATFDTSNKDRVQSSEDTDQSISSPYDSQRYRRQKYKEPSSSFQKRDIFGNQNDNLIQVILDADNKRAVALLENNAEGQARYDLAASSGGDLDPSNQQVINLVYPVQFDRRERDTSRKRRDTVKRNINDDTKKKRKTTETKTKLTDNNCPPQHAVDSKEAGSSTVIKRESSSGWKPSQLTSLKSSLNKVQDDWEEIDNLRSILKGMGLLDAPEKREVVNEKEEKNTEDKREVKKDENLVQKREDIQKAEDESWKQNTNNAPEEKKKREINLEEEEEEDVEEEIDSDLQKRDTDSEEDSEDENLDDQLEKRKIQEQITDDLDELDGFDSKDVQRVERNKRQNFESDTNKEKRRSDEDEYAKKMEAEIQTKINAIKEKVKREITLEENKRDKRETLKDKNDETSNQAKAKKRAAEDDESEKHENLADDLDLKKREALDDMDSVKETSEEADIEKRDTAKELDLEEEHDTKDLVKRDASNKLNAEPSDIAKEVTNASPLKKRDLSELEDDDESELEKRDLSDDDGFEAEDKSNSIVKRDFQSKSASEKLEALKAMDLLLQKRAESLKEREDGVEKRDNYKRQRSKKRETAKDNSANQEKHDSLSDFDRSLVKRDIKDPTLDSKTPDLHLEKREKSDETADEMESDGGESPKMKLKKRSTINKLELKSSRSKRKTETEKKEETNKGCETREGKQKMADTNKKIFKREIATASLDNQDRENDGSELLQDDTLKLNKRAVGTTYLDLEKESEVKNDEDNVKLVKRDIGVYDFTDLNLDPNARALKRVKRKIETSNLDQTGSSKIITLADLELENSQIPKDSSKLIKRDIPEESSSKLEQTASDLNSPIAEDPEKELKREITADDESKITDNSDSSDEYPGPVGDGLPLHFNQRNLDTEPETYFENPNLNIRRKRADFDFNPYQTDENMEQDTDESDDYSSSVLAKKRALSDDDEPEEYIRTYYPERRKLRTFAKNDDLKDDEDEEEEDEEENEYFGPLPESYNGELTRYKRVKRYN